MTANLSDTKTVEPAPPRAQRNVQINLALPSWQFPSRPKLARLRWILLSASMLVLAVIACFIFKAYQEHQEASRQLAYSQEMPQEAQAMEQMSNTWANINRQTLVNRPTELRNMLPAHSGWANLTALQLNKDGLAVLSTTLQLTPKPQAGVHSILVSRLYDMNNYTVFRFVSCKDNGVQLQAAKSLDGILASQQPFDLRTALCPYKK